MVDWGNFLILFLVTTAIALGIGATTPLWPDLNAQLQTLPGLISASFIRAGLVEEVGKVISWICWAIPVQSLNKQGHWGRQLLFFSGTSGLIFGVVENMLLCAAANIEPPPEIEKVFGSFPMMIATIRMLTIPAMHTAASMIGCFVFQYLLESKSRNLVRWSLSIMSGLLLAVVIHGVFDAFVFLNQRHDFRWAYHAAIGWHILCDAVAIRAIFAYWREESHIKNTTIPVVLDTEIIL